MCGRFTRMMPWPELMRLYRLTETWEKQRNDAPAYNVAPTDDSDIEEVRKGEKPSRRRSLFDKAE